MLGEQAAGQRRCRRRSRPGPAGDQVAVARRVVAGGELEHAVEQQPAAAGPAAVEAERELVEVARAGAQSSHRALVGAQQPPRPGSCGSARC